MNNIAKCWNFEV